VLENQKPGAPWLESGSGQKTFLTESCQIGRGANNTVVLPSEKVSRQHATIHMQGENEFLLIDLGSANGTYLNGRRVNQPSRLADKDIITIGDHSFRFLHPEQVRPAEADTTNKTIQEIRNLDLWLLVADVEAATQFAKRASEEAPRVMGRWLNNCKQVIDQNGGTINKFLGDGFFAYWLDNDTAAAAVANTLKTLKQAQEKADPRFRVVLHYGKVFVGGAASLGEESLMGNEVNFIFRVEKLAGGLGVLRLLSEPASIQISSHLPNELQGRHAVASFDGEYTFFTF
jgi:pSer/pThr/pTyr-binding forkhead associated (FHA) protein